MPVDDIDDALRRQPAWDPPAGFSHRVASAAMRLPRQPAAARLPTATTAWHVVRDAISNCFAIANGVAWVLRQYWALLAR